MGLVDSYTPSIKTTILRKFTLMWWIDMKEIILAKIRSDDIIFSFGGMEIEEYTIRREILNEMLMELEDE